VTAFQDHLTEVKQGIHKYRRDVQEGKREAQEKDVEKFGKVEGMVYQRYSFDFAQNWSLPHSKPNQFFL